MHKNSILELLPIGNPYPDSRRCDPVSAISGAVGIGTSIFSGINGASAAKKAAAAQAQAAQAASDKVGDATNSANAGIAGATQNAQNIATGVSNRYIDTAGAAANRVTDAANAANNLLDPFANTGYTATGELNRGLAAGGDFNKTPTMADLQIDPGYAFRLQQGQIALDRSAAARGGALSGEAAKAMAGYSQGLASQEYQNAFNRFQTATQNRFNNLMTASNAGQTAATTQGGNLTTGAARAGDFQMQGAQGSGQALEYGANAGMVGAGQIGDNTMRGAIAQGDYLTQKGNAQASGYVGSANAWNGMAGGISNAVSGAATMNLLKNPATDMGGGYYSSTRGYVRTR